MSEIQKALEKKGWFLTPEAIKQCSQGEKNITADSIINTALDASIHYHLMDLHIRGLLQKSLPDGIGRSTANKVPFPLVLQIVKVTNVAAPTYNQESQTAPPLLRIHVTDGFSTCCALDMSNIQGLSLKTFPGAKICLKAAVQVRNGMILLTNENAKFLGGKVEKLIRKVKANQAMIKTSSGDDSSGPPPFIPFQEYIKNNPDINKQVSDSYNTKSGGKSSMEPRGNNRSERFQNRNTDNSRSKSDDKSQNWRNHQSSYQPQGASGRGTSRSENDMRYQNKTVEGPGPSRGATNTGKMALWQALDKQLDLRGTDKGNDRQASKHVQDGFGDRYADMRSSDNSRYQSEPTRGRGFRNRPYNPSSTSRQPPQQLYQPPVSHNEQMYQQQDNRGGYRGRGGYPSRARGRGRANYQNRW